MRPLGDAGGEAAIPVLAGIIVGTLVAFRTKQKGPMPKDLDPVFAHGDKFTDQDIDDKISEANAWPRSLERTQALTYWVARKYWRLPAEQRIAIIESGSIDPQIRHAILKYAKLTQLTYPELRWWNGFGYKPLDKIATHDELMDMVAERRPTFYWLDAALGGWLYRTQNAVRNAFGILLPDVTLDLNDFNDSEVTSWPLTDSAQGPIEFLPPNGPTPRPGLAQPGEDTDIYFSDSGFGGSW